MLKEGGNVDIFDRLYKKTSQYENLPQQVTDNIYFLNKHCKFLSYAEKENIIILLRKRDPTLEYTILQFKSNKISKQHMKDTFYTILYPKRLTKRCNENVNPMESDSKNLRGKRSPDAFDRTKDSFSTIGIKIDLALDTLSSNTVYNKEAEIKGAQKRMEYMNSLATQRDNIKSSKPSTQRNAHAKTRSVIHMPSFNSNSSHIHEEPENMLEKKQAPRKLSEIDQFIQKLQDKVDYYTKPTTSFAEKAEAQNSSIMSGMRIETFQDQSIQSHNEKSLREMGLTRSLQNPMEDIETLQSDSFLPRKPRRVEEISDEEYKKEKIPSGSPVRNNDMDSMSLVMGSHAIQNSEPDNPFTKGSVREEIDTSGRGNNRIFILQHMGTEGDSTVGDMKESGKIRRIEEALEDTKESLLYTRATAQFINNYDNGYQQRSGEKDMAGIYYDNIEKLPELNSVENPVMQLDSEKSIQQEIIYSKPILESEEHYKPYPDLVKRVEQIQLDSMASPRFTSPEKINLDLPLERQSQSIQSIQTMQTLPEISLTLAQTKSSPVVLDTPSEAQRKGSQEIKKQEENVNTSRKKQLKELEIANSTSQPIPLNQDKLPYFSPASANVTPRSFSPTSRDTRTDLGNSDSYGNKGDRFVSVNLIKRIFEENSIYAEDIVDEIFRYLGEHIVNKNYFTQIMTDFLNGLPENSGIKPKDISIKIFEICDRNGDGLISANDLGSRATLFSQLKTQKTKEKTLYNLLDPQGRGFIIETDIINALTNAQALACENGANLFDDYEELLKEARKIVRDLDKESKGIITYWDIFLWKDTESFADLSQKLQKYTKKSDTFTSAKKSGLPPKEHKNIFYTAQKMFDDSEMASPTGFKPFSSVNDEFIETHQYSKSQAFEGHELKSKGIDSKMANIRQTAHFTPRTYAETPELSTAMGGTSRREYYTGNLNVKHGEGNDKKGYKNHKEHTRADSETDNSKNIESSRSEKEMYRYREDLESRESECRTANSFV